MGFREALTSTFIGPDYLEKIYGSGCYDPLRLVLPVSSDESLLRPALWPALLACLKRNLNQRWQDLRLFELGKVFARTPGSQDTGEEKHLGLAVTGRLKPASWSGEAREFGFFDLKGVLEALFSSLKLPEPGVRPNPHPVLHPGVSASIELEGTKIGHLGRINPAVARRLDLPAEIYLLELDLEPLISREVNPAYQERSPFPGSRRDLSVLVAEKVPCGELIREIKNGSPLVAELVVFDLYQGEHVPAGKKSLAVSILFQSRERTLRDEEVDKVFNGIFKALVKKFGVQPR
jgi:phenylalanyl-tRNA synthetase beta chain